MTFKYEPRGAWGPPADPKLCPASVMHNWQSSQCRHKRGGHAEGWCTAHDPERRKAKREESHKRFLDRIDKERLRDIENGLRLASVEQLKAELKRRKKAGK